MKTIFAKYNSERLPCFQIVTRIIQENGVLKALKEPLSPLAMGHINKIYNNYQFLLDRYPQIKLCRPKLAEGRIEFEMIRGDSFEKILKSALDNQDKPLFIKLIGQYISYLDSFVAISQVKFDPCSKFTEIFGPCIIDKPQDVINIANIDLIFSNLFLLNDEITIIDYEWIFDFAIPKSFVMWRAVIMFFNNYSRAYQDQIHLAEVLSILDIDIHLHEQYIVLDRSFGRFVYGNKYEYSLNMANLQPRLDPFKQLEIIKQDLEDRTRELEEKARELVTITNQVTHIKDIELFYLAMKFRSVYLCIKKPVIWFRALFK